MDVSNLKQIMLDQKEVFNSKKSLINRSVDLSKYISSEQIIVVSGVRRCGKSSLLYLIKEKMKLKDEDFLYFNFDDERISKDFKIFEQLYVSHLEMYGKEPILFLDEIQNIDLWAKFVNRMYEKSLKLFITGSNAKILSSEISTSLTGRNLVINLYPFSFKELLDLNKHVYSLKKLSTKEIIKLKKYYNIYYKFGGFPLVAKEQNFEIIKTYFKDILYRDIIARQNLRQIEEIKQIAVYFASNIGKLFSYSTLQKITGIKSTSSIKSYLTYYDVANLFFYLKKYDYSIKKQELNQKKVYIIDIALASQIGFNFSKNSGRMIENLVFIELKRRGKEIFYHKDKHECDFLINENKIVSAIQVCQELTDDNRKREIAGLLEALNKYKLTNGLILTENQEEIIIVDSKKIIVMPVWKWLLE